MRATLSVDYFGEKVNALSPRPVSWQFWMQSKTVTQCIHIHEWDGTEEFSGEKTESLVPAEQSCKEFCLFVVVSFLFFSNISYG